VALSVLHVAQSSEYGLGRYLTDLVGDQVARGWQVRLAGDPASTVRNDVERAGAAWVPWAASREPGPSVVAEARALASIVSTARPDVVHLHSSKAGLAGRLALRGRRPTLFQPHAWSFYAVDGPRRHAARLWERVGARWAHLVICGSDGERDQGEAAGIRARWRVVPNAVDVDHFSPGAAAEARAALGIAADARLVVCAARLAVAQKGQDLLVRAWPAVAAAEPGARLVLVGDGPDRELLERSAPPGVDFVGEQRDPLPWFRAADVVVQPSRYETLSLSVLEALACARPVVATDAVGMREAIGAAGAVVPLEDADALAAAVAHRLRHPEEARAEGEAGRSRVVERYSRRAWGERLADLTLEVAAS
jgi:glycosyltransferase involved in cell wall biosynthesis